MLLKRKLTPKQFGFGWVCLIVLIVLTVPQSARAFDKVTITDTIPSSDTTLPFPIHDRRGDYLSNDNSTYDHV